MLDTSRFKITRPAVPPYRFEESLAEEAVKCAVALFGRLFLWVMPSRHDDVLYNRGRIQGPSVPRLERLLDVAVVPPSYQHGAGDLVARLEVRRVHGEIQCGRCTVALAHAIDLLGRAAPQVFACRLGLEPALAVPVLLQLLLHKVLEGPGEQSFGEVIGLSPTHPVVGMQRPTAGTLRPHPVGGDDLDARERADAVRVIQRQSWRNLVPGHVGQRVAMQAQDPGPVPPERRLIVTCGSLVCSCRC
jgi:hypothetical protein